MLIAKLIRFGQLAYKVGGKWAGWTGSKDYDWQYEVQMVASY